MGSFDDNHIKEQQTLETIQEGLQNSIKDDQQSGANAKQKMKKSDSAKKEEHLGDPDEALEEFINMGKQAATAKKRIEAQNVGQTLWQEIFKNG